MSAVSKGVKGLTHTQLTAATQPCWEMTWGTQATRAELTLCWGRLPVNELCTALHSSVLLCTAVWCSGLLWAALGTCTWALLGRPSGAPANEPQGLLRHLGQCVTWLCSSHMLKKQASLHNLKLLAKTVGYEVSAPVIKFFHSERAKFSPPYSAKGVQWAQRSSCGHRTS